MYRVLLARPVQAQLDALPEDAYGRVHARLTALAGQPRPPGCLKVEADVFRIRVGEHRVIYEVCDAERRVLVLRVARRSEKTYRGL